MNKLYPISGRKVVQKLKRIGFKETHQRGSHLYLEFEGKIVTVPMHGSKDIPIGTLYSIVVKQAKLSIEEFQDL